MRDISNESEIHGIKSSVLNGDMFLLIFQFRIKKKKRKFSVSIQKEIMHTLVYEDETFKK